MELFVILDIFCNSHSFYHAFLNNLDIQPRYNSTALYTLVWSVLFLVSIGGI